MLMTSSILSNGQPVDNELLVVKPRIQWTASGLSHAFPNSTPAAKRRIKELKHQVLKLQEKQRFSAPRNPEVEFYVNFVNIDHDIFQMMKQVVFLEKYVRLCKRSKVERGKLDVLRAKQVPISSWIEFNRAGFASCPLHNDKTPSLKYYEKENKVHCFSCGFQGDVIDVVMKIRECSFIDAVKILL